MELETASIAATLVPQMAPRIAGQTIADMPDYATFVSVQNYVTTAAKAEIASVVPAFFGVADAGTPVVAGTQVSLSVTVTDSVGTVAVFDTAAITVAPADFNALHPLVVSALHAGQSVGDVADFAAMTDIGNFTSNAAPVADVQVICTGAAITVETVLAEGDIAGFQVLVTDGLGNTALFDAGTVTVGAAPSAWSLSGGVIDASPPPPAPPSVAGTVISVWSLSGGVIAVSPLPPAPPAVAGTVISA